MYRNNNLSFNTTSDCLLLLNPFMPDGISHSYLFDQSITVLRVVRWGIFHFYSKFNRDIL